jgi:hypothetical protein
MSDDMSCASCGNLESRLDSAYEQIGKLEKELKNLKSVGATGQFPHGRVDANDLGELKVACYVKNGKLILDFGKDLSWLAMTKEEAKILTMGLLKMAEKLPR